MHGHPYLNATCIYATCNMQHEGMADAGAGWAWRDYGAAGQYASSDRTGCKGVNDAVQRFQVMLLFVWLSKKPHPPTIPSHRAKENAICLAGNDSIWEGTSPGDSADQHGLAADRHWPSGMPVCSTIPSHEAKSPPGSPPHGSFLAAIKSWMAMHDLMLTRGASGVGSGSPPRAEERDGSAEANLAEDALAGEHLREETNDETHHGQTAVPGFCKINEAEAGG